MELLKRDVIFLMKRLRYDLVFIYFEKEKYCVKNFVNVVGKRDL